VQVEEGNTNDFLLVSKFKIRTHSTTLSRSLALRGGIPNFFTEKKRKIKIEDDIVPESNTSLLHFPGINQTTTTNKKKKKLFRRQQRLGFIEVLQNDSFP